MRQLLCRIVLTTDQKGAIAERQRSWQAAIRARRRRIEAAVDGDRYDLIFECDRRSFACSASGRARAGGCRRRRDVAHRRRTARDDRHARTRHRDVDADRGVLPGHSSCCSTYPLELASMGDGSVHLRLAPQSQQPAARDQLGGGLRVDARLGRSWGHSSAGRASGWHPEGRRVRSRWLHSKSCSDASVRARLRSVERTSCSRLSTNVFLVRRTA